jgi:hypothetical protein
MNKSMAAVLLACLWAAAPAAAQTTIFNTKDFRQDRALWTDPAYYRNNTVGQLRGMALNVTAQGDSGQEADARLYDSEGTGRAGAVNLASPYPYKTHILIRPLGSTIRHGLQKRTAGRSTPRRQFPIGAAAGPAVAVSAAERIPRATSPRC